MHSENKERKHKTADFLLHSQPEIGVLILSPDTKKGGSGTVETVDKVIENQMMMDAWIRVTQTENIPGVRGFEGLRDENLQALHDLAARGFLDPDRHDVNLDENLFLIVLASSCMFESISCI